MESQRKPKAVREIGQTADRLAPTASEAGGPILCLKLEATLV
jgi:hypothetical protein